MKARCIAAKTPAMVEARTVAVRCACHTRRPWLGSGVHGRGGDGRAAAVHSRRVGECAGLLRPRDAIGERRSRRIIRLARTARRGRGGEAFNYMRMGNPHGCIPTTVVVEGKGKGDQGGARGERENASPPAIPAMLLASVRWPQPSGEEDQISRAT
eukprot:5455597-Pleurochrysis_carterae.AAC.1